MRPMRWLSWPVDLGFHHEMLADGYLAIRWDRREPTSDVVDVCGTRMIAYEAPSGHNPGWPK